MNQLSRKIQNFAAKISYEDYLMTGFQNPEYLYEKCFFFVTLEFDNNSSHHKIPWIIVGNDSIDFKCLDLLKANFAELDLEEKHCQKYYFKDVPVKLVLFNNEIIAIGNPKGNKFLLVSKLTDKPISKTKLKSYIHKLIQQEVNSIFDDFTESVNSMLNFLKEHEKHISKSPEDIAYITKSVSELAEYLNNDA